MTVIVPTKNRPLDLERAIRSVCEQSRMPDELLIIDQSAEDTSRNRVMVMLSNTALAHVDYVYDPGISGLIAAKQIAVSRARGDVLCFIEDDVVLEPDYVKNMERGFIDHPDMIGACGIVTGLPPLPRFYSLLFHVFHRGIFFDARVGVHGVLKGDGHPLIPSHYISGGLSAYRRRVFEVVPFDLENGFFMLEDIDFSTRVAREFGAHLYINPNARLDHRMSPVNRAVQGPRQERKVREFIVFYKKARGHGSHPVHLALLGVGLFLEALFQSAKSRSLRPVGGFFRGLWRGARWKIAGS